MLYRNASFDGNISLHDYYTTDGNAYNAELGFEHNQSRDVSYRVYFMAEAMNGMERKLIILWIKLEINYNLITEILYLPMGCQKINNFLVQYKNKIQKNKITF